MRTEPLDERRAPGVGAMRYSVTVMRITLRLPDDLYAEILAAAETERRSLNGQLLWLVEHGIQATKESHGDQA